MFVWRLQAALSHHVMLTISCGLILSLNTQSQSWWRCPHFTTEDVKKELVCPSFQRFCPPWYFNSINGRVLGAEGLQEWIKDETQSITPLSFDSVCDVCILSSWGNICWWVLLFVCTGRWWTQPSPQSQREPSHTFTCCSSCEWPDTSLNTTNSWFFLTNS